MFLGVVSTAVWCFFDKELKKVWLGLTVALAVVILDHCSKYYILWFLQENAYVPFGDYFNIVRAWNTGVSFSMLNDYGNVGAWMLSALAAGIVVMLFYWLKKEDNRAVQLALGLIMGGAVGNIVDRVRFGAVFDFLDFHVVDWHWPAFNVADSCICIGAAIIVWEALRAKINKKGL